MKRLGLYTYLYRVRNYGVGQYESANMRVEIVGERSNRYRVKYLGLHANGAAFGTLHWVRKDKVHEDSPPPAEVVEREGWLPYKDD